MKNGISCRNNPELFNRILLMKNGISCRNNPEFLIQSIDDFCKMMLLFWRYCQHCEGEAGVGSGLGSGQGCDNLRGPWSRTTST